VGGSFLFFFFFFCFGVVGRVVTVVEGVRLASPVAVGWGDRGFFFCCLLPGSLLLLTSSEGCNCRVRLGSWGWGSWVGLGGHGGSFGLWGGGGLLFFLWGLLGVFLFFCRVSGGVLFGV